MPASVARLHWMDLIRGAAIVLVVLMHAPHVPTLLGYPETPWLVAVNDFFQPYRMPALMFLSGMLLDRSLKKPLRQYYAGKLALLVWPYLVWAALHIGLYGSLYNQDMSFLRPRSWFATSYLWFLFDIAVFYLAAPLVRFVPPWVLSLAAFAISIPLPNEVLTSMAYFAGFFFAGQFASRRHDLLDDYTWGAPPIAMGLAAAMFGVATSINGAARFQYDALFAVFSIYGIIAAIAIAKALPASRVTDLLQFVGRNSIIFYVSHFPVMLGVTVAAMGLGVESPMLMTIIGFFLAWVVGFGLVRVRWIVPFVWLFNAPSVRRREPAKIPA